MEPNQSNNQNQATSQFQSQGVQDQNNQGDSGGIFGDNSSSTNPVEEGSADNKGSFENQRTPSFGSPNSVSSEGKEQQGHSGFGASPFSKEGVKDNNQAIPGSFDSTEESKGPLASQSQTPVSPQNDSSKPSFSSSPEGAGDSSGSNDSTSGDNSGDSGTESGNQPKEKSSEEESSKGDIGKENNAKNDNFSKAEKEKEKSNELDWNAIEIGNEVKSLMTYDSASKYHFIPFEEGPDYIKVAIVDETDMNTQNALRFFANKNKKRVETFPISEIDFEFLLNQFKEDPGEKIGQFVQDFEKSAEEDQIKDLSRTTGDTELEVLKDAPVAKMVEVIIKNAIDGRASDIHIEPLDGGVRVRYRVDGILHNSISLPKKIGPAIVSRVKILSNLKIDEKRKPQDGRFRVKDLGRIVDFRVSTFPTSHGEKVVLRILDTQTGVIEVDDLGFQGRDLKALQSTIQEPFGIILVTGPTGSGKSTTLYAVLKILNQEGVNIVTLEDPVEYVLEGVNQSQVKPEIGYDFASGLRSILRQDPDVVMVGEIRDEETAELAIHAALTGHLVLSTLHTNSAVGGVARLVDMGIQPFLLSSALNLLIGQRLVRKICSECKEEVPHSEIPREALDMIKSELKKMPKGALERLKISDANNVSDEQIKLYRGKGCGRCHSSGYKGRLGIFEVLELNNELSKMVGDGDNINDIETKAKEGGYTIMKQDGILKSLQGLTTIEEVQRVTEDENEDIALEGKAG